MGCSPKSRERLWDSVQPSLSSRPLRSDGRRVQSLGQEMMGTWVVVMTLVLE